MKKFVILREEGSSVLLHVTRQRTALMKCPFKFLPHEEKRDTIRCLMLRAKCRAKLEIIQQRYKRGDDNQRKSI